MKSLLLALASIPFTIASASAFPYVVSRTNAVLTQGEDTLLQTVNVGTTLADRMSFLEADLGVGATLNGDEEFVITNKVTASKYFDNTTSIRLEVQPIYFTSSDRIDVNAELELRYDFF